MIDLDEIREYLKWPDRLTDTGARHLRALVAEVERLQGKLDALQDKMDACDEVVAAAQFVVGWANRVTNGGHNTYPMSQGDIAYLADPLERLRGRGR